MPVVEAVVFDKDDTLLNTERLNLVARQQTIMEFGGDPKSYTVTLHRELLGTSAHDMFVQIKSRIALAADFDTFLERYRKIYMSVYEEKGIETMEGAIPLLQELKSAGLRLAVATGAGKLSTDYTLKKAGIDGYFDVITTSDQVQRGKPHPDIFLRAAENLGVNPLRCAAVGDGINDIIGAKRAGMLAILYEVYPEIPTIFPQGIEERPDFTVTKLSTISQILLDRFTPGG